MREAMRALGVSRQTVCRCQARRTRRRPCHVRQTKRPAYQSDRPTARPLRSYLMNQGALCSTFQAIHDVNLQWSSDLPTRPERPSGAMFDDPLIDLGLHRWSIERESSTRPATPFPGRPIQRHPSCGPSHGLGGRLATSSAPPEWRERATLCRTDRRRSPFFEPELLVEAPHRRDTLAVDRHGMTRKSMPPTRACSRSRVGISWRHGAH